MPKLTEIIKDLQDYYGRDLTQAQLNIYMRNLSDLDITSLRQGVDHLIKNGHPFFPKVSELRQAAKQYPPLPQGKADNADYWSAMSTYNDVLAGRQAETALQPHRRFYPEVQDAPSSD